MPIRTQCTFSRDKLYHGKKNVGHLMVTLDAPEREIERTPLNATLILDVSPSMNDPMAGERKSKIDGLKEVARRIIQQLSSQDKVAIIAYAGTSRVVVECTSVENKDKIYSAIDALNTNQYSTNIGAGLVDGLRCVDSDFKGTKRIFLVSDGLSNTGIDSSSIKALVKNRSSYDKDVVVSTFGLGADCDQEFMADLAKLGSGNYYFVRTVSDMGDTFARELGGALACEAQNIEITVNPNNGNRVVNILNDFSVEDVNGAAVINAEDLFVGEKRHVLIEMEVDEVKHPKPRQISIAHVEIKFHDAKTHKATKESHNIRVLFVKSDEADKEDKLEVVEQVAILTVAKTSLEAVKYANMGNFSAAQAVYSQAIDEVGAAVDAGSVLCSSIQDDVTNRMGVFTAASYNMDAGNDISSDSRGTLKQRGSSIRGISAKLYSSKSVEDMIQNFAEPEVEMIVSEEEEKAEDDTSSFAKRRNRQ